MREREDTAALILLAAKKEALKKVVFSRPVAGDIVRATGELRLVRGTTVLQIETFFSDNKARHENLPVKDASLPLLEEKIGAFAQVNVLTTAGDAELRFTKRGVLLAGCEKLTRKLAGDAAPALPLRGNNKEKTHILSGKEPFLFLLGVADKDGRVFDKKQAKFRQINRFLEILSDVVPQLPKGDLTVADLCCGKSYLSFAVYHYLTAVLHRRVTMIGVDLKADVVAYCSDAAKKLGFSGLTFTAADVARVALPEKIDLVVSLHACDTATDLVLDRALGAKAGVILATPCCHHELFHNLHCPPLDFIAEYSMLKQKLCDAATDALRLKHLEAAGYSVAALELIDPDETPKNILLRAVRRPDAGSGSKREARAASEYRAARAFLFGKEEE